MSSAPLTFPLPWQQRQWQRLTGLVAQQRLPHAVILSGSEGCGKSGFVEALVGYLLCCAPQIAAEGVAIPCGQCDSCRFMAAGNHTDLVWLQPQSKAEEERSKGYLDVGMVRREIDPQREISVNGVRELIDFLGLSARLGRGKVAVLLHSERLNYNAANALLKTLEEPSASATLFLVTSEPDRLLPTIRSRCQHYTLQLDSDALAQAAAWLQLQSGATATVVADALLLAADAPLKALAYLEADRAAAITAYVDTLLALREQRLNPLAVAADWSAKGGEPHLGWFYLLMLAVTRQRFTQGQVVGQLTPQLQASLATVAAVPWFGFTEKLQLTIERWPQRRANRQLLLEELLLSWQYL
ncbi:MAG: hypothetical protein HQL49_05175 [Gammaproteobacteria bacterium]|nr:hypothetical protein [Gammaproteobacteria bacterium]